MTDTPASSDSEPSFTKAHFTTITVVAPEGLAEHPDAAGSLAALAAVREEAVKSVHFEPSASRWWIEDNGNQVGVFIQTPDHDPAAYDEGRRCRGCGCSAVIADQALIQEGEDSRIYLATMELLAEPSTACFAALGLTTAERWGTGVGVAETEAPTVEEPEARIELGRIDNLPPNMRNQELAHRLGILLSATLENESTPSGPWERLEFDVGDEPGSWTLHGYLWEPKASHYPHFYVGVNGGCPGCEDELARMKRRAVVVQATPEATAIRIDAAVERAVVAEAEVERLHEAIGQQTANNKRLREKVSRMRRRAVKAEKANRSLRTRVRSLEAALRPDVDGAEEFVPGLTLGVRDFDGARTYFARLRNVPEGWKVRRHGDEAWLPVPDVARDTVWVQCRAEAPLIDTENVPLFEARGRVLIAEDGSTRKIAEVGSDEGGPWVSLDGCSMLRIREYVQDDGTVIVIVMP